MLARNSLAPHTLYPCGQAFARPLLGPCGSYEAFPLPSYRQCVLGIVSLTLSFGGIQYHDQTWLALHRSLGEIWTMRCVKERSLQSSWRGSWGYLIPF